MKHLFYFVFTLLLSYNAVAQPGFELGFTTGFGTGYASNERINTITPGLAGNMCFKALVDTRYMQAGLGVDIGAVSTAEVERDFTVLSSKQGIIGEGIYTDNIEQAQFATPYYSPFMFVNVKIPTNANLYFYVGGVGGYTFTRHGFDMRPFESNTHYRNVRGVMAGANIGLSIRLTNLLILDIHEGWRMSALKEPDPAGYMAFERSKRVGGFGNSFLYYSPESFVTKYTVHVLTSNIGLRFRL